MRFVFNSLILILFFGLAVNAQELTRAQKLQKIDELNKQIKILEKDVLAPDAKDFKQAQTEGLSVFRLMPREKYDGKMTIRGGGAYYSFSQKTSKYGNGSDIELSQNYLSVGFAGADYGFIYDLGDVPLATVSKETTEASFLAGYKPPTNEPEIRIEQSKSRNYESNGILYKDRVPSVVGHAYLLRSLNFGSSDVLVAFKVYRKDTDGSLIIFWKNIADFDAPQIERNQAVVIDSPQPFEAKAETMDYEVLNSVQSALVEKGLFNISVEATNTTVTLRGTVPKGKMAEAVRIAQETGKKKVMNQLTEQ
ncbi:MAG: BON domain-containing protein [Acidobacteriota bacterium]|nr:BON domain-containing protein [Acidobacteriota bacterium]